MRGREATPAEQRPCSSALRARTRAASWARPKRAISQVADEAQALHSEGVVVKEWGATVPELERAGAL
jgi:hypothetical protein